MPKVKILSDTVVNGKPIKKGKIVECNKNDAQLLVAYGKAEPVEAKPE